jgi:hypothetical protein
MHTIAADTRRCRQEDHKFENSPGKVSGTLSQKQNTNKKATGVAQEVEHLPSLSKALGSTPSPKIKKKRERERGWEREREREGENGEEERKEGRKN